MTCREGAGGATWNSLLCLGVENMTINRDAECPGAKWTEQMHSAHRSSVSLGKVLAQKQGPSEEQGGCRLESCDGLGGGCESQQESKEEFAKGLRPLQSTGNLESQ